MHLLLVVLKFLHLASRISTSNYSGFCHLSVQPLMQLHLTILCISVYVSMALSFRYLHFRPLINSVQQFTGSRLSSSWNGRQDNNDRRSSNNPRHQRDNYGFDNSRDRRSDVKRGNGRNAYQNYRSQQQTDIRSEPVYGRYDGDHLYGIAPVKLALKAKRRKVSELLVQDDMDVENKKDSSGATEILKLAEENQIPIRHFSKHDLNMISDNRPHQGFILRAEPLQFIKMSALENQEAYKVILALDEVWDPQNFGALLRTSYFLGIDKVVVSAKNSAPLSAAVSKASSGAMEVMDVFSTDNMMKFLDLSKTNGWQVVGTALSPTATTLDTLPLQPTILLLGNEGHGLRTNVIRKCDYIVKVDKKGGSDNDGIDSLNVSVTGGILLYQLSQKK